MQRVAAAGGHAARLLLQRLMATEVLAASEGELPYWFTVSFKREFERKYSFFEQKREFETTVTELEVRKHIIVINKSAYPFYL